MVRGILQSPAGQPSRIQGLSLDYLTFWSEVIKALAWPAVATLLIVKLRKPLLDLVPFLRKLKYKEFELEFAKEVAELKADSAERPAIDALPPESTPIRESWLQEMATFSPRAAVIEAWLEVETAAVEAASSFWTQPSTASIKNFPRLGEYLLQCNVIDHKQLNTFRKLRELRNKAAHLENLELSEKDVRSYINLATGLAAEIRAR